MIREQDIGNIASWINNYFTSCGKTNAIVGISGGIDSAVVASLCVRALGKERVLGVVLPIESAITDATDAQNLIDDLGIDYVNLDIENSFNDWHYTIISDPKIYQFISNKAMTNNEVMVRGNAKARFRMTTLYALAEMADGLVVGTTNKSESKIGYATKYGDGGVDIEPIMDYYKTEIFEMAELLEVNKNIINKKPSAGLWPGQTDEDEIGMAYSEVDRVLRYIEGSRLETHTGSIIEPSMDVIRRMIITNDHKLHTPPQYTRI